MSKKKIIVLAVLLILITGILTGCRQYASLKPGQCMWCDGYGYYSWLGNDGKYHSNTCSHCGGTGRSR